MNNNEYILSNPSVTEEERMIQDKIDEVYDKRDAEADAFWKAVEDAYWQAVEDAYFSQLDYADFLSN